MQRRSSETAAIIQVYLPGIKVGLITSNELLTQSTALGDLAQLRDDAIADYDMAVNNEYQGFLLLRLLCLGLPTAADGELDGSVQEESDLRDLLDEALGIVPRNTEAATERSQKLVAALSEINAWLAAQVPPRDPITSGGKGLPELIAALAAQPTLIQAVETAHTTANKARRNLSNGALAVDRLNKRFHKKLKSEARSNPQLAAALPQIETENAHQPGTLSIRSVLQGGADQRQILVTYDNGTGGHATTLEIEWWIVDVDQNFAHRLPIQPAGNTLGPFLTSQTVKLRTRTRNSHGTTTSSVRTLKLQPPVG